MSGKWDVANEQFMDFINAALENNSDEQFIEESGQLLSKFSFFIVALEKQDGTEFQKLYNFALVIHEASFSERDQLTIVFKAFRIIEEVFPEFFKEHKKDILQLFYEIIRAPLVNVSLLVQMQDVDQSTLAYPDFVKIQIAEMERLKDYFDDENSKEVRQIMDQLKSTQ